MSLFDINDNNYRSHDSEIRPNNPPSRKRPHDESEVDDGNSLVKKMRKEPKILDGKYFEVKSRDSNSNNISAVCKLCGIIKKGSCVGTGNFLKHIKIDHAEKSAEVYDYIKNISSKNENGFDPLQTRFAIAIPPEKVL